MKINTNSIILTGNLCRDAELKYTQSNKPVLQFTIACNNGQKADFFTCVLWESTAEGIAKYMTKGKPVLVRGRLQTRSYEAKDGTKKTVYEINCEKFNGIEFLGGGERAAAPQQAQPQAQSRGWNPLDVEPEPQAPAPRQDQGGIPF